MQRYILAATLLGSCTAAALASNKPTCTTFTVPVKVTATTKDFPSDLNIADLLADPASLPGKIVSYPLTTTTVNYNISARYCEPQKLSPRRSKTLQVLIHGNTYTQNYWDTPGQSRLPLNPDQYSWINYAADQGYSTLAIDLPCNGASTRADPINQCQLTLGAEAVNEIITAARSGTLHKTCANGRSFNQIIYVGHSYGSAVANSLAQTHPSSVNAYILTGFTGNLSTGSLGAILIPQYQPAALVDPARFGSLPPGYLMATNAAGAQQMFYDGNYVTKVAELDYTNRGTVTAGEGLTTGFGQATIPAYTGAVFVLNGNEDEIACQADPLGAFSGVKGNCANGFSQAVGSMYPNARAFSFFNAPKTGHSLDFHLSAQDSFKAAHDFLKKVGF